MEIEALRLEVVSVDVWACCSKTLFLLIFLGTLLLALHQLLF